MTVMDGTPDSVDLLQLEAAKQHLVAMPQVTQTRLRQQCLAWLQAERQQRNLGGMLLFDAVNLCHATDCRNMQIWMVHNSARCCLVPLPRGAVGVITRG